MTVQHKCPMCDKPMFPVSNPHVFECHTQGCPVVKVLVQYATTKSVKTLLQLVYEGEITT